MSTVNDALQARKNSNVLQAPTTSEVASTSRKTVSLSTQTDSTLSISLVNNTSSSNVYAYVNGLASDNENVVFLLQR